MPVYKITWKVSAIKDILKIDKLHVPRIINAVESLANNPFPKNSKKLFSSESAYRIRVGTYRIVYTISRSQLIIEIVRVAHRKDVYR